MFPSCLLLTARYLERLKPLLSVGVIVWMKRTSGEALELAFFDAVTHRFIVGVFCPHVLFR